jgi:hypothetical protein
VHPRAVETIYAAKMRTSPNINVRGHTIASAHLAAYANDSVYLGGGVV